MESPNTNFWPILFNDKNVGKITSSVYSPRLKKNIALAMIDINYTKIGIELKTINNIKYHKTNCKIIEKPFFDPKKKEIFFFLRTI